MIHEGELQHLTLDESTPNDRKDSIQEDLCLIKEMIDIGWIEGTVRPGLNGPNGVFGMRMKHPGRVALQ